MEYEETMILSDLYESLTLVDSVTKKELIRIDCNGIDITSPNLEVHLLPKE